MLYYHLLSWVIYSVFVLISLIRAKSTSDVFEGVTGKQHILSPGPGPDQQQPPRWSTIITIYLYKLFLR